MRCGLYGKLPSKRDFVSIATPRHFLQIWEPWIADCLAQSRDALGDANWDRVFSEAPIWRFVLGTDLDGGGGFGVLMPSMDAIGRYFPLTLVAQAEPGGALPKPDIEHGQTWFAAAEDFLMSLLDAGTARTAIDTGLKSLSACDMQPPRDGSATAAEASVGFIGLYDADAIGRPLEDFFTDDDGGATADESFWWTLGNENYKPRAFVQRSLPGPLQFTAMLTEEFSCRPPDSSQSE